MFFGQSEVDTLASKSFDYLKEKFDSNIEDTVKLNIYASAFLKKAKIKKDTLNIAKGFHYKYYINKDNNEGICFLDSIINITKDKKYEQYPLTAYNLKNIYYFKKHDYQKSLDCLLETKKINETQFYNEDTDFMVNHSIGLIKSRLGEYRSAINIFLNNNKRKLSNENKLTTFFAIADTYRFLKKHDSSSYYNLKGIKKSLKDQNNYWYNYFLLNEGATLSRKSLYLKSIDTIKKSLPEIINIDDQQNIMMAYFYLGKNNYSLGKKEKALFFFKKVDSTYLNINDIHPELREGYEILIKESKANNNVKDELLYINKLLNLDKVLSNNYKVLSKKINQEFDTPILLKKKDIVINKINDTNKSYSYYIFFLALTILFISTYLFNVNRNKKRYKETIEELLLANSKEKIGKKEKKINKKSSDLKINKQTISNILNALEKFESEKGYLNNKITSHTLAKKINTNTQYLSKIINHYKKENFSNYLNNLRVEFATNKLIKDKTYRKYTVSAIAKEVGFNSAEAFSIAFHKKNNIKPSNFIKNIDKVSRNL